jgi:hypothetical protein
MTATQFQKMVNHESGMLGISEISSDVRDLLAQEASLQRCRCFGATRYSRTGSAISFQRQWSGNSSGALWPPAIRFRDPGNSQLHSLPNALHHQHVHATQAQRSTIAGASRVKESGLHQSVRRNSGRCRLHGGVFGASGPDAVYELLGIERKIPPITPHDKSLRTQFEALIKAFK